MKRHSLNTFLLFGIGLLLTQCNKKIEKMQPTYTESYRPQYHFSPPTAWMNDPNGMVYYEGEYHLFYQHYPEDVVWGPMHWGHAVSKDLLHWEHLPIALYPDALGYIFSGSAVIDWKNTSGFGSLEQPPMVAIFTYHDPKGAEEGKIDFQTQGIAYSLDKGRSWTKYSDNPVLHNPGIQDFRDPKVFWHADSQRWIMALAVKNKVSFYSAPNLKDWELESDFGSTVGAHGGVWECPDLFPLTTADGSTKWVLLVSINPGGPQGGSATQYFIGDFDGTTFTPQDTTVRWMDWGADNYAGVTFSAIPDQDGRRILIGWMSNWEYANKVPTSPWRSAMTLPRTLSLTQENETTYLLQSEVVEEIESLLEAPTLIDVGLPQQLPQQQIKLHFELPSEGDWSITLGNTKDEKLLIFSEGDTLIFDRRLAGDSSFSPEFAKKMELPLNGIQPKQLNLFLDASSIELIVNEKELFATNLIYPSAPLLQLQTENITSGSYQKINGVWNTLKGKENNKEASLTLK